MKKLAPWKRDHLSIGGWIRYQSYSDQPPVYSICPSPRCLLKWQRRLRSFKGISFGMGKMKSHSRPGISVRTKTMEFWELAGVLLDKWLWRFSLKALLFELKVDYKQIWSMSGVLNLVLSKSSKFSVGSLFRLLSGNVCSSNFLSLMVGGHGNVLGELCTAKRLQMMYPDLCNVPTSLLYLLPTTESHWLSYCPLAMGLLQKHSLVIFVGYARRINQLVASGCTLCQKRPKNSLACMLLSGPFWLEHQIGFSRCCYRCEGDLWN